MSYEQCVIGADGRCTRWAHDHPGEDAAYWDGYDQGAADRAPDVERMALGANRLNSYERGYIDSGHAVQRRGHAAR